jgi:hypothetical protein
LHSEIWGRIGETKKGRVSASSKLPMCIQQTAFPFQNHPCHWILFSEVLEYEISGKYLTEIKKYTVSWCSNIHKIELKIKTCGV